MTASIFIPRGHFSSEPQVVLMVSTEQKSSHHCHKWPYVASSHSSKFAKTEKRESKLKLAKKHLQNEVLKDLIRKL